jgi:alkanesulfonate monooxygenase SsuD/methylene tetrahydromethanopterin reductase-like flavin-dependent oxidoreductase (luciferase family)
VQWAEVQAAARAAGRDPAVLTPAMYLTLALDDDAARADARINGYLERYYGMRPDAMRKRQMCFAGNAKGAAAWLKSYADAGVAHMCLRLAGDPEPQMEAVARMRQELGW